MSDIYETDLIPTEIDDYQKKSAQGAEHGTLGHNGFRCGQCAGLSSDSKITANDHGVDYFQNKQIGWQEECDVIMSQFQTDVADHFPDHLPQNCQTCPVKPDLPPKPMPPIERSLGKRNTE